MVERTYGSTDIPGPQVTFLGGGTVTVDVTPNSVVGLVGGMDVDNGEATPGEVYPVASPPDAARLFGENSELYQQVTLVQNNNASQIFAVGVTETEVTDDFISTSSGTLSEQPLDPEVHYEHEIVETGGSDVIVTYEDPVPVPSDVDTVYVNPVTKDWEADSAGSYDFEYVTGDYTTAITNMAQESPGVLTVLHEDETLIGEGATLANNYDDEFTFMNVVGNATPGLSPSSYSDTTDDFRVSLVASARGYVDAGLTKKARTAGAFAARVASQPLGVSATNDTLRGFTGLVDDFTPQQASQLTDKGVAPLIHLGNVKIVKDMTTSTDARFERVYTIRVADEVAQAINSTAQNYTGTQYTDRNLQLFRRSSIRTLSAMRDGIPKMLDNFTFRYLDSSTDNRVTLEIGIDVVGVIDNIVVNLVLGDVVENGGLQ